MTVATPTPITPTGVILSIIIAVIFVALCSLLREPARQRFSAIFVAGVGPAYLSSGFAAWEPAFCPLMSELAYHGLAGYRAIGVAWLFISGRDLAQDLYGNPMIPFAPDSFLGCFVCDPVVALWYLVRAPEVLLRPGRRGRRSPA